MVFLELRRDSRVTTGNSGCLLKVWTTAQKQQKREHAGLGNAFLHQSHCKKTRRGSGGDTHTHTHTHTHTQKPQTSLISHRNEHEESIQGKSHTTFIIRKNKEQTSIFTGGKSRPGRCTHKRDQTITYHFKTNLSDIKQIIQDVKEHHKSESERLSIEVTEFRKELTD